MEVSISGVPLLAYLFASLRIMAWLMLVPPFSTKAVPATVKTTLSLGLAFAAAPEIGATAMSTTTWDIVLTAAAQIMIGAAMGFVTMLLFSAFAAAGSMIDMFGGFAVAQAFDPLLMTNNTVFGRFHQALATVLLFVSGGYLLVIGGLLKSFSVLPVGGDTMMVGSVDMIIKVFEVFLITAIQMAMPMIAVLFVADLGLALMTKVAPALNPLGVMFPAKIGLTLLLVGLTFPKLPEAVSRLVDLVLQAQAQIAGAG